MSRRQKDLQKAQGPGVIAADAAPENLVSTFFDTTGPTQEVVILNTEKGFIPETLNLKKGGNYKIHIVNVNEKDKNVSFILDAFSEHHGTYFGQPKTFSIVPKVEGIYSFQCPETSKQGRIVVTGTENETRKPASK
jgi:plastocyanin